MLPEVVFLTIFSHKIMFSSSVDNQVPLFVLNLERISQIISHFDSGLIVYGLYRANQTGTCFIVFAVAVCCV